MAGHDTIDQLQKMPAAASDDTPLARSIGQILHDHLEEIVGPETAALVRGQQKGRGE